MEKLGFDQQPYLVYQHHDAGYPHIHIVTTNIQADGSRIDLHHLGIRKSEPARKEIEKMFGLVVADEWQYPRIFRRVHIQARNIEHLRFKFRIRAFSTPVFYFVRLQIGFFQDLMYFALADTNLLPDPFLRPIGVTSGGLFASLLDNQCFLPGGYGGRLSAPRSIFQATKS